jgi:hypothetical protein
MMLHAIRKSAMEKKGIPGHGGRNENYEKYHQECKEIKNHTHHHFSGGVEGRNLRRR